MTLQEHWVFMENDTFRKSIDGRLTQLEETAQALTEIVQKYIEDAPNVQTMTKINQFMTNLEDRLTKLEHSLQKLR